MGPSAIHKEIYFKSGIHCKQTTIDGNQKWSLSEENKNAFQYDAFHPHVTVWGGLPDRDPLLDREALLDRDPIPGQRPPWTETPWAENPLDKDPLQ